MINTISAIVAVISAIGTVAVTIWMVLEARNHPTRGAQAPKGESTEPHTACRFSSPQQNGTAVNFQAPELQPRQASPTKGNCAQSALAEQAHLTDSQAHKGRREYDE